MVGLSVSLFSCKKNDALEEYQALKTKPFKTMSAPEKMLFKENLVKILKADSNFIKFDNMVRKMTVDQIKAHQYKKGMGRTPAFGTDLIKFYKAKNIHKPSDYVKAKVLAISYLLLLRRDYPELFHLDKAIKKEIFAQASPKLKVVSTLRAKKAKKLLLKN